MKKFYLSIRILLLFLPALTVATRLRAQPIGCNGQFFISHGSAATSTSTTSVKKLTFSSGTISANAFSTDPTGIGFNAIGLNPLDGYMYGLRYPASGAKARLVRIGSTTPNNVVDLGLVSSSDLSNGDVVYAGCFDSDGTYYFISDNDEFFKITGLNSPAVVLTATKISNVSPSGFFVDIAIDPTDGQMYGVSFNRVVYKVNKSTGALTSLGTHAGTDYIAALFFDEIGTLYGYRQDGTFQQINKTNATLTQVGTAPSYTYADGCSCSFGRVFHDLDFTANPGNQICPTLASPSPSFPLVVSVTNQSSSQKTGLTYTLNISDPAKRFRFTESTAAIKANLVTAGLATAGSTVTLTAESPASGTNYNKLVVSGFQTGGVNQTLSFTLQVQLYTTGGTYISVPLQSEITGLPVVLGSADLSNDPTTVAPDDPTTITFCPNITLPVDFQSFAAVRKGSQVELKWATSTEQNNKGFYAERKVGNSDTWETLGFVNSLATGGNSSDVLNYSFVDFNETKSISQYRIRQVDIDSRSKYSEVRSVRGLDQKGTIIVYPNPTNDGKVNVVFEDKNVIREIALIDMSGRVVKQMKNVSNNNIVIDNLLSGMYTLRVYVPATGEQAVEKIVVNKK